MSHGFSTDNLSQEPLLPNQPFFSWLRTQTALFTSQIAALLTVLSVVASVAYYIIKLGHEAPINDLKMVVVYAHLPFLVVFIVALIRVLDDNDRGSYRVRMVYDRIFVSHLTSPQTRLYLKRSQARLKTFKRCFLLFWCSMFFLYVGFAFKYGVELSAVAPNDPPQPPPPLVAKGEHRDWGRVFVVAAVYVGPIDAAGNRTGGEAKSQPPNPTKEDKVYLSFIPFALNNLSLLFIFWCFVVLYEPSQKSPYIFYAWRKRRLRRIQKEQRDKRAKESSSSNHSKETPDESAPVPRSLRGRPRGRLGVRFWLRAALKRQVLLRTFSFLIIVVLTLSFWLLKPTSDQMSQQSIDDYVAILNTLSGILNSIVLALLIARLDSKLIGLPSWLICILYLYAAVQPLFFAFEIFPSIAVSVLIVVFIFKIYFFLIIMYTLQTGRMLNYFFCFPFVAMRLAHERSAKRLEAESNSSDSGEPRRFLTSVLSPNITRTMSFILGTLGVAWLSFVLPYFASKVARADYSGPFAAPADLTLAFDVLHVFFALLIIVFVFRQRKAASRDEIDAKIGKVLRILNQPSPQPEALERSGKQLLKFKQYFLLFWLLIALLYLVLGGSHFAEQTPRTSAQAPSSSDALLLQNARTDDVRPASPNSTQPAPLTQPPPSSESQQPSTKPEEKLVGLRRVFGELWVHVLIFALNNFSLLFLFYCFAVLYLPALDDESEKKQNLLFRYGLFAVGMFTLAFPALLALPAWEGLTGDNLNTYTIVFNGISGTLNALVLALLIARLDSKFFNLSSFLIFVLLTYAALQPIFAIFEAKKPLYIGLQTLVVVSALLFKLCFFLMVMDTWRTGTMHTYLFCFPVINKRIDSIFENQFEFKTSREGEHGFGLSILKGSALIYSSDRLFHSRAQCDERAAKLRQLMGDDRNYRCREQSGTHWVVVNDRVFFHSLCESIPLRSKDEAEKLVKESVEKIPYCKYNRS